MVREKRSVGAAEHLVNPSVLLILAMLDTRLITAFAVRVGKDLKRFALTSSLFSFSTAFSAR
tara:strand:- start:648 stop:833 length:186 start_codon:yes stop_codon:yes gene_type:complete